MAHNEPEPVRITTAGTGHGADLRARQRRYLISMGVRTACFVAAVLVFETTGQGWLLWVLIAASFVLPYVAVVMANAQAGTDPSGPDPVGPDESRKSIPPGQGG